jgi:hypothetical protein
MSSSDGRIKAEAARYRRMVNRIEANYQHDVQIVDSRFYAYAVLLRNQYEKAVEALDQERAIEGRLLEQSKQRQLAAASADRDERLEDEVKDQLALMRDRSHEAGAEKGQEFLWLHGRSFDATYRDRGPVEGKRRVRKRIEALIDHAQGDEELLLGYYRQYLNYFFPITYRYDWDPVIKRVNGHDTIVHKWSRVKAPVQPFVEIGGEEGEE